VAAVVAYRHARNYYGRGAVAWALFALVGGIPGLLGYWLHRRWPHRERCAQCGAIVPRDSDECLACSADFPVPTLKGVEIFA
jgi:hypothetical protein